MPRSAVHCVCVEHSLLPRCDPTVSVKSNDDKAVAKDVIERQVARLLQFGSITIKTVKPLLQALQQNNSKDADDRSLVRVLFYLVQLALGDGSAGTPMPVPPSKGAWTHNATHGVNVFWINTH